MAGVNITNGLKRINGDKKLYRKLLLGFISTNKDIVKQISKDIKADNIKKAMEKIHTLKGTSGNLGLLKCYAQTVKIEVLLNEKYNLKGVNKLLTELDKLMHALIKEIEKKIRQPSLQKRTQKEDLTVFNQLRDLLSVNDPDAIKLVDRIDSTRYQDSAELKASINGFDFDKALVILKKIMKTNA